MPYRIEKPDKLQEEIVRIATEQVDSALDELSDPDVDRHEGVHQARKRFKKIRGLLRLIRFELGDKYKLENEFYRDIGRKLSDVRDAQAMIETLDILRNAEHQKLSENQFEKIHARLSQRRKHIADNAVELDRTVEEVVASLNDARERISDWTLSAGDFSSLQPGLEKSYKRGRKAFANTEMDATPETFHEWRKRVKYFWYHSRLLREIWPEVMVVQIDSSKRLSDLLGDEHDLSVFRNLLNEEGDITADLGVDSSLIEIIDNERNSLRRQAMTQGRYIYAEKPKLYGRRLNKYWDAWAASSDGT
jgi:CHAD domain-containing protein